MTVASLPIPSRPWTNSSSKAASRCRARSCRRATRTPRYPCSQRRLLTEEEVVLRNIPRIRDVDAMIELLRGLGVRSEWREDNVVALCAADVDGRRCARPRGLEPHPRVVPVRGPAARPLRPRRGAEPGRRRHRPPPARPAPGRLPRARRERRLRPHRLPHQRAARPARLRLLHGRAVGHGHRERADGGRSHARVDRHPQRRVRAARPGPRAAAAPDGRAHRGHRVERADRPRPGQARRRRLRDRSRLHRDRLVRRAGRCHRRRAAHQGRDTRATCG